MDWRCTLAHYQVDSGTEVMPPFCEKHQRNYEYIIFSKGKVLVCRSCLDGKPPAPEASRSVQRRMALQKGEPLPTFAPEASEAASLVELIEGAIARGWCHPENRSKVMDVELAKAIAEEIWHVLAGHTRPTAPRTVGESAELGGTIGLDGDTRRDWETDGPALEKQVGDLKGHLRWTLANLANPDDVSDITEWLAKRAAALEASKP